MTLSHGPRAASVPVARLAILVWAGFVSFHGLNKDIWAQPAPVPPAVHRGEASEGARKPDRLDSAPVLRVEPLGVGSLATALAFGPDGGTLYVAADKVIHVWERRVGGEGRQDGERFINDPRRTLRVPIGPGDLGRINAMAVSRGGDWVAAGGFGTFLGHAGFRDGGLVFPGTRPTLSRLRDIGAVYIFAPAGGPPLRLEAQPGQILGLEFVEADGDVPMLVTVGRDESDPVRSTLALNLWDLRHRRVVASQTLPDLSADPKLAAWRTGPEDKEVRVAVALNDDRLRVWDVADNELDEKEISYCCAAGSLPGGGALAAGWKRLEVIDRDGEGRTLPLPVASFPKLPVAVRPIMSGGRPAAAAIVCEDADDGGRHTFRLAIANLSDGRPLLPHPIELAGDKPPVLAADAAGRHLAVVSQGEQELQIYDSAALLRGETEPMQTVGPRGVVASGVTFARREGRLGLALSLAGDRGKAKGLGFDLEFAEVSDPDGWTAEHPPEAEWRVRVERGEPDRLLPTYRLQFVDPRGWTRTTKPVRSQEAPIVRLCPAADRPAVVAVATYEPGSPRLAVYDATTGRRLRVLSGHSERVRDLACSADGRLLVSAGEDRVINLWWLPDLAGLVGVRGGLPGLTLEPADGSLKVIGVGNEASDGTRANLSPGDFLLGMVGGPTATEISLPATNVGRFLNSLSQRRPGDTVWLRLRRGDSVRNVKVTLEQAVDERKPLASILLDRRGADGWSWIAWSPFGPFESNDAEIERLVGWHFNPADGVDGIIRFAELAEYREQFFGRGLLPRLIESGRVPAEWPPRENAELSLLLQDEHGRELQPDGLGHVPLRSTSGRLLAAAAGLPAGRSAVRWRIDDRDLRNFDAAVGDSTWTADLSAVPWDRGVHRIRVEAFRVGRDGEGVTDENPIVVTETWVRFQPGAPELSTDLPAQGQTQRPVFNFTASVRAADPTTLRLVHRHGGKSSTLPVEPVGDQIAVPVSLRPGENELELVAMSRNALTGHEAAETSHLVRRVTLSVPDPPPAIEQFVTDPAADALGRVSVDRPTVRFRGRVSSKAALESVRLVRPGGEAVVPGGFQPGGITFEFEEAVVLEPGSQRLKLVAATAEHETVREVDVDYLPPLPDCSIVRPAVKLDVFDANVDVEALLTGGSGRPFAAEVIITSAGRPERVQQAATAGGRLKAVCPVSPGTSLIRVRLRNEWGGTSTTQPVVIRYLQPPVVEELRAADRTDGNRADVDGKVRSAWPLTFDPSAVTVNGRPVGVEQVQVSPVENQEGVWSVSVRGVPLDPDRNTILLKPSNRDGEAREPKTVEVVQVSRPPAKPVISFPDFGESAVTPREIRLTVQIRAEQPLAEVVLAVNGERRPLPLPGPNESGSYEFAESVQFDRDTNVIEVSARTTDGGHGVGRLSVTSPHEPVRVVIDTIEDGGAVRPVRSEGGLYRGGEAVTSAAATLRGRILWDDAAEAGLPDSLTVQGWVNGFLQRSAEATAVAGRNEAAFSLPVTLHRERDNEIRLELPRVAENRSGRAVCTLDCMRPETRQRLHLLLVNVNVAEEQGPAFVRQTMEALAVQNGRAPAFERVLPFRPLVGHVNAGSIRQNLLTYRMRTAAGDGQLDVLLFYFVGPEVVGENGFALVTSEYGGGDRLDASAISSGYLDRVLSGTGGAHLVFLDVTGRRTGLDVWPTSNRLGVMRSVWKGVGQIPDELTLAVALRETLPTTPSLGPIAVAIGDSRSSNRLITFDANLPAQFRPLVLGVVAESRR